MNTLKELRELDWLKKYWSKKEGKEYKELEVLRKYKSNKKIIKTMKKELKTLKAMEKERTDKIRIYFNELKDISKDFEDLRIELSSSKKIVLGDTIVGGHSLFAWNANM